MLHEVIWIESRINRTCVFQEEKDTSEVCSCTEESPGAGVESRQPSAPLERGLRTDETCQHLDLRRPGSRIVKNSFLLFKPPGPWCFVLAKWA